MDPDLLSNRDVPTRGLLGDAERHAHRDVARAHPGALVGDVVANLHGHRYETLAAVAVLDGHQLKGLVRLEDLLDAPVDSRIEAIMDSSAPTVGPSTDPDGEPRRIDPSDHVRRRPGSRSMHVVLAVDGSPSSAQARDLVASRPWPEGTAVTLAAAYHIPATWVTEGAVGAGDWLAESMAAMHREAEDSLASMTAPLEGRGWVIERRVGRGRAADVIQAIADEVDADLIVLGSRGRGQIASMLLGSVSAEVADQARRSVLVARGSAVSRLLVATDGSKCASILPDTLAEWGSFRGLPALALSVAPVDSPAFKLLVTLYTLGNEPAELRPDALQELHHRYATELAGRLTEHGIPAAAEVRLGDAAHEIIAAASARQADLVVTGSRCLHGLDRWLLGSVARNVLLHSHTSVLIVRPKAALGRS
jgi:nucleotide-binding universal stress UspA family protein